MWHRGLLGPALMALGAAGLLLFSRSGDYVGSWRPVAEPLDLTETALTVATFSARPEARYSLGVEVDWEGPAECLLGVRRSSQEPPCETEPELSVEWAVRANGAEISRGDMSTYAGSSWGGGSGIAASLGVFVTGPEEADHEVSLRVLSPAPTLARLNPRLVVSIGGKERKDDFAPRVLASLIGMGGLLVSVGAAMWVLWRRQRAS